MSHILRRLTLLFAVLSLALLGSSWISVPQEKPAEKEKKAAEKKPPAKEGLPLKPERKIEFTTDEGTWISLDVSPDGKTIVFELLGDLYTLPLEGGEAARITSGMPFDTQPRYSPDGKMIAFLSDRDGAENIWIAKADGSEPKQLSKDKQSEFASPAWTPDGEYVVVSRMAEALRTFELWMYHVKGGAGVQITKAKPKPDTPRAEQHNALGAAASSDGRYLYYERKLGGFGYNLTFPLWQIARRDRVTGDEDILTQAPGSAFRPLVSPDGNRLVYGTRFETQTGLRIRDLSTGEDRWLKYPVARDDQESRFTRDVLPGYAFTPGGQAIVVSYGGKIHRVNVETGEDRLVPFTARVSLEVGPLLNFPERVEEGPVRARLIQGPVESPDSKRLAFSVLTHLYVMDLPHGKPVRITGGDSREFQPAWSPDGQWLAYVTWENEEGQIWKVPAGGQGQPQRLTRAPAFYRDPAWSPDGSRIVALRAPRRERIGRAVDFGSPAGMDIIWIPTEGGDAHLIAPARGAGRPHFTREKDRVYVYSSEGLLSMRFDGTDRRTHLKVVGKPPAAPEPVPAQDVRISPGGDMALALVFNQLYLLAVPRIGGEPPNVNVQTPSVPLKKLTEVGADYFGWSEDGKTLTWALGSSFFRKPVSTVVFEEKKQPEEKEENADSSDPEPGQEKEPSRQEAEKKAKEPPPEEIEVTIEQPRHRPSGTIVLRGARVITMHGDEIIPSADVVVTGNRIAGVGRRGAVAIPQDARIFDVKGATILPGIVDVHAHWFEIRRGVLDMQNWNFLANLAYGVTTGRDPQTATNDMFAYQDLVDVGEMIGPRAYSTGPGVFSTTNFQSAEEARNVVAKYKKYYRTHTLKSYMVGNRKQRQWMVEACQFHKMMPTTEGGLDLELDLTHALDGFSGNEHALPIVPLYKDVAEVFARSGISYTPTLLVAYGGPWAENYFYETTEVHNDAKLRRFIPHDYLDSKTERRPWFRYEEHVFPKLAASAAKIVEAGGRVCLGGHGQLQGIQCHWEMWALRSGGLSNLEVLRTATLRGAEAIGLAQDLGSIETGKLADLMVLEKNPLDDIRNTNTIRYVMKNGELFEGDTLNQVWPEQKKLPPLWWWEEKP